MTARGNLRPGKLILSQGTRASAPREETKRLFGMCLLFQSPVRHPTGTPEKGVTHRARTRRLRPLRQPSLLLPRARPRAEISPLGPSSVARSQRPVRQSTGPGLTNTTPGLFSKPKIMCVSGNPWWFGLVAWGLLCFLQASAGNPS